VQRVGENQPVEKEEMMKIAVIGVGNVGRTLGVRWAQNGHQVVFGARDPGGEKVRRAVIEAGGNATTAAVAEAAAGARVVVLATPWHATQSAVTAAGDLAGKVVVDCTNPLAPGLQPALSATTSGAEQVAQWAVGARVVKAFNTTGYENMADPTYDGGPVTMFICGDDTAAKEIVAGLAGELGFEVVDAGPLPVARNLEALALVWIRLAMGQGFGRNIAFKLVRR
jgi:8-hydroxy-5-deazaflavin:NADPH oxidoreductase